EARGEGRGDTAGQSGARSEGFIRSVEGFAGIGGAFGIAAGSAHGERSIGERGNGEEGERTLLLDSEVIDRHVIADCVIPHAQTSFRLRTCREQLHGEFMVWAEGG